MKTTPKFFQLLLTAALLLSSLPLSAKVIHVAKQPGPPGDGSSWQGAFKMISAGLTASASGDEIWVKSATYPEAITMKAGVDLYGGFAGTETDRETQGLHHAPGSNTGAKRVTNPLPASPGRFRPLAPLGPVAHRETEDRRGMLNLPWTEGTSAPMRGNGAGANRAFR